MFRVSLVIVYILGARCKEKGPTVGSLWTLQEQSLACVQFRSWTAGGSSCYVEFLSPLGAVPCIASMFKKLIEPHLRKYRKMHCCEKRRWNGRQTNWGAGKWPYLWIYADQIYLCHLDQIVNYTLFACLHQSHCPRAWAQM